MKRIEKILSQGSSRGWPQKIIAYTDGASRGNPGPASFGVSVLDSKGQVIFETADYLGEKTNNEAEYMGIYCVLEMAVENKVQDLLIKTDSQLIVRQLKGDYKVKKAHLKPFYAQCVKKINQIPLCQIEHIVREKNKRADELANLALDHKPFI